MAAADPVATLDRWCQSGAGYRVVHVSDQRAVVELLSCLGEPEDRIESGDPRLIERLRREAREG
jgi:hypothetical protein